MYAELQSHYFVFANMSAQQVYIFPAELRTIIRVFYQSRKSKKLEIILKTLFTARRNKALLYLSCAAF